MIDLCHLWAKLKFNVFLYESQRNIFFINFWWWVNLGQMPGAHQAALSLLLFNWTK